MTTFQHKGRDYVAHPTILHGDYGPENYVLIKNKDGDVVASYSEAMRTASIIRLFKDECDICPGCGLPEENTGGYATLCEKCYREVYS